MDKEDNDTEHDKSNSNNISFNEEDKNIILENRVESEVDINIKDYYIENKEKLKLD